MLFYSLWCIEKLPKSPPMVLWRLELQFRLNGREERYFPNYLYGKFAPLASEGSCDDWKSILNIWAIFQAILGELLKLKTSITHQFREFLHETLSWLCSSKLIGVWSRNFTIPLPTAAKYRKRLFTRSKKLSMFYKRKFIH